MPKVLAKNPHRKNTDESLGSNPYQKPSGSSIRKDRFKKEVTTGHAHVGLLTLDVEKDQKDFLSNKKGIKKREKQRMKREKWIKTLAQKISNIPSKVNHSEVSKSPYINLNQISEALGSISDEEDDTNNKSGHRKTFANNGKEIQDNLKKVHLIMNHPDYAKNPLETIKRHLFNTN